MDYAASRKVPEAELSEPAALRPAPVRWDRVEEARHDSAEDDVSVEMAALSNGAGDNGSTSGSKGALEGEVSVIGDVCQSAEAPRPAGGRFLFTISTWRKFSKRCQK